VTVTLRKGKIMNKGLTVRIARVLGGDCTNGGVSSRHDSLTVVAFIGQDGIVRPLPPRSRVFAATPSAPAVALRHGPMNTVHIVPLSEDGTVAGWHMMGGNYAAVTDSRLRDVVAVLLEHDFYGAIAIHDRVE